MLWAKSMDNTHIPVYILKIFVFVIYFELVIFKKLSRFRGARVCTVSCVYYIKWFKAFDKEDFEHSLL
jgi:hypothetical protein